MQPHRGRCSRFGFRPDLLPLQGNTLGFSTLALNVRRLELLALQRTHPRLHFGIRTCAVTRGHLCRRCHPLALLLKLRQPFKLCGTFLRRLLSGLFGGNALPRLFDRHFLGGNTLRRFVFSLLFGGHTLARGDRGRFGAARLRLGLRRHALLDRESFGRTAGCQFLRGVHLKNLFLLLFLNALAFIRLNKGCPLRSLTR